MALTPISAHSSRNKTPRWARLTAPGRANPEPPPTKAATLDVWCGATNGGRVISGVPPDNSPATEWIAVTSSASSESAGQ